MLIIILISLITTLAYISFLIIGEAPMYDLTYFGLLVFYIIFTWLFLKGNTKKVGKKINAEILPINYYSDEEFKAIFKRSKNERMIKNACIAKYEIDETTQYEIIGQNRMYNYKPGKIGEIYVITHKEGIKKDYQVLPKNWIINNRIYGIIFLIQSIIWIIVPIILLLI